MICFNIFRPRAGATAIWTVGFPGKVNSESDVSKEAEDHRNGSQEPVLFEPDVFRFHCHTISHCTDRRMSQGIYGTSSAGLLYPLGGSVNLAGGRSYPHSTRSSALPCG